MAKKKRGNVVGEEEREREQKMFLHSCMKHSVQLIFSIPFHAFGERDGTGRRVGKKKEETKAGKEMENTSSSKCKEFLHVFLSAFVVYVRSELIVVQATRIHSIAM